MVLFRLRMNIIKTLFLYTLLISELVFETCGSLKQTFHRMSFVCDICNFVGHKKTHSDRSFVCERCGDSCNRKDALKHHMKKHSQEKTHQCQYCSSKFYRHDMYSDHQKMCEFEKQVGQGLKRNVREGQDEKTLAKKRI